MKTLYKLVLISMLVSATCVVETKGEFPGKPNIVFLLADGMNRDPFCLFIASNDSHGPLTTGDRSVYNSESFTIPPYWLDIPELRNELVSMADITPTLVEAAGGKLKPEDCDGQSFLKMLKGEIQILHPYLYGAFTNCNIIGSDVASSWVELLRIKPTAEPLVYRLHHRSEYELYHLDNDPYELRNEIHNPGYQDVAEEMKKQLHIKLAELGDSDPISTEKSLVKDNLGVFIHPFMIN